MRMVAGTPTRQKWGREKKGVVGIRFNVVRMNVQTILTPVIRERKAGEENRGGGERKREK